MRPSDELRASKERYNEMKKQLEMEGIVVGQVSGGWGWGGGVGVLVRGWKER